MTDDGKVESREAELPTTGALLRNPSFFILWVAGVSYGTLRWLEILSIGLHAYDKTGSPLVVAGLMIARMAPMVLLGSYVGTLADRFDRKRLLLGGLCLVIATSATLATLAMLEELPLWALAMGTFVSGMFFTMDLTVRRALLGEAAGPNAIGRALALDSATSNATRMLGPICGGIVYEAVGLSGAYTTSAFAYVVIVALVSRLPTPGRLRDSCAESYWSSMRGALAFARTSPSIVPTLSITVIINIWAFPVLTMVPVIGRGPLELSATGVGLLASAEGAGAFLGALVLSMTVRATSYVRVYVVGSSMFLAGVIVFSLATQASWAWSALFVGGIGVAGFAAMQPTLIMASTPPEYRSRIMGLLTMCIGTGPLGIFHLGAMAEWLGPNTAVMVMAAEGVMVLLAVLAYWPVLRQRSL